MQPEAPGEKSVNMSGDGGGGDKLPSGEVTARGSLAELQRISQFDAVMVEHRRQDLHYLDEVAAADAAEVWFADGAPSMGEWLVARYRATSFQARTDVKLAHAVQALPEIRGAYAEGVISRDQLRALAGIAAPDTEHELLAQCVTMSPSEIKSLRRVVTTADEAVAHEDRSVRYWFHERDPIFEMHVTLPDVEGAKFITALTRKASVMDANPNTGLPYLHEQRLADALVQMASESLSIDADHDRATLLVQTDIPTLLEAGDGVPGIGTQATLGDGTLVPAGTTITNATLRRLACDARIQLALTDPGAGVVGIGRTSRTIPPWLARIIRSRDGGCRFPQCVRRSWLQIHHIEHWADGGPTDLDNLITLCGFHHRLIHHEGWTILGNPNGRVRWLTKWGTRFARHPRHQYMNLIRSAHENPRAVRPPERPTRG